MCKEFTELRESNGKIIDIVTTLKTENDRLKKCFENCAKFKNFNILNNNDVQIIKNPDENLDEVFEPQYIQKIRIIKQAVKLIIVKRRKKNLVVGSMKATKLTAASKPERPLKTFDSYTGFWSLQSDESSVKEFIDNFASVESIRELKTKGDYYKSYYFSVKSNYMEHVLNQENWPDNIRLKRYFESKQKKQQNTNKSDADETVETRVHQSNFRGPYRGREGFSSGFGRNNLRNDSFKRNRSEDDESGTDNTTHP
ncbi:unnamed protein product [Brachionus calyciflorus]|uniref:Uncharacterized protein n=1 Tax=Brachionus calyciflorus TaxID=104777 RepID=A0A814F0T9_9BILA|nr:unnamed protein product [Brachionus calyciflorus]